MKHLKLFFALFAMLALGVGNAWGAEYELVTSEPSDWSGEYLVVYNKGCFNGSLTTGFDKSAPVTVTISNNKINLDEKYAMIIGKQGTAYSLKTASGYYIGRESSSSNGMDANQTWSTKYTINFTWDATKKTVKIAGTGGKCLGLNSTTWRFYAASNTYVNLSLYKKVESGSTEPVPSLTATPIAVDFGNVVLGSDVESKTVSVNFENLTGNVTYSGLSNPFSATGNISTTGDKITISADASTIGEYSQTLTIASTADSKTAVVTVRMNVVEKPAPTGTFTLHTGDVIEGDYVIYYSGKAMKAVVSSNRLGYEEVTPSGNEIVDPLAETIWHIAPSGSNWTIYNDNKGYAAGTGTKSQAQLIANLTGDNANKAAWTVTGTSTYEFTNVWNTSKSVNAALRNNGTYGFACYAIGTGGALSLYRKAGAKYNVTVNSINGTVTADPTSAEAGTPITLTVTPAGGYVLDALTVTDASSNPVTVTDNKFTMPASDVTVTATFKANEKPAATLTLSKNGVEEPFPGSWKQDDVVTLPSITSDCVKEFVGWSANPTCNEAPEYAAGDSYTLAATAQTLYAVYATAGAGETLTITPSAVSGSADPYTFTIDAAGYSLTAKKNGGSTAPTYTSNEVRVYAKGTVTLTAPKAMGTIVFNISTNGKKRLAPITASVGTIATQASGDATVTWTGDATEVTFTVGDIAEFGSENTKAGQLCFGTMTVTTAGSYSNYSTTCSAALANPTFSLTEGKYTEAKSVEIEYTEGTVYYTMDGTEPTASSTQYTAAIALNDCGEYTIKAIAISSDSQSDVVSATYTIKLPLTNSQAAPYTEAEAIAAYDGGCYDNQDVYVKGTVKSATFSSTYGNYTITLTNGFQFYRFLQAAETKFTEDIIVPGDVLIACGKLSKYQTTYQLAEGCYLVERIPYEGEKTDISNTETTAYTVDQAFALIADVSSDLTKEVYVKGIVAVAPTSNPTDAGKMTYSISDNGANTGNVLKVYLGLGLEGAAFTSKDDVKQGDYVVAKGKLLDYSGTYELTDNQLVQHKKAATITIADITMEVGETKTIAATVTPEGASIAYTIKAGSDNCITLKGAEITATAAGTATIVATIAETADYMGATKEITVIVTAPEQALTDWVLTSLSDITIKDLVVITMTKGETTWAMTNDKGTTAAPVASVVTLSADALAAEPDANLKWVVSNDNGTLTIYPYGTYETWLYCTNTNNGVRVGTGEAKEFTINGNYLYTSQTTDARYLGVYDGANWRCYTSINSNIEDQTLAFYVKKNANDVLPGTGEEPGDDPVVPTPTINPTATFIFNTAEGLTNLGITYPATEDEDNAGSYKTEFENNATFTQDGITMTTTGGTTVATRVWLTAAGKLDLRVYKGATLTFSVPAEHQISKVVFDGSNIGHLLVNETAVSSNAWTGSAQTITFTAKSDASTIKINTIAFVVEYTRNVTNKYGSICLPYASASTSGAYFYEVVGKGTENGKDAVYLASVNTLKAGVPYIFEKTANTIKVVYSSEKEDTPQNANGLIGTFEEITVPNDAYILYRGAFCTNNDETKPNKINAYRAYLDLSAVNGGAPQQMPGRRYIGMSVQGENGATGVEDLFTTDAPVKVIENGQLIIIRNGEKYNVQGQKL